MNVPVIGTYALPARQIHCHADRESSEPSFECGKHVFHAAIFENFFVLSQSAEVHTVEGFFLLLRMPGIVNGTAIASMLPHQLLVSLQGTGGHRLQDLLVRCFLASNQAHGCDGARFAKPMAGVLEQE